MAIAVASSKTRDSSHVRNGRARALDGLFAEFSLSAAPAFDRKNHFAAFLDDRTQLTWCLSRPLMRAYSNCWVWTAKRPGGRDCETNQEEGRRGNRQRKEGRDRPRQRQRRRMRREAVLSKNWKRKKKEEEKKKKVPAEFRVHATRIARSRISALSLLSRTSSFGARPLAFNTTSLTSTHTKPPPQNEQQDLHKVTFTPTR